MSAANSRGEAGQQFTGGRDVPGRFGRRLFNRRCGGVLRRSLGFLRGRLGVAGRLDRDLGRFPNGLTAIGFSDRPGLSRRIGPGAGRALTNGPQGRRRLLPGQDYLEPGIQLRAAEDSVTCCGLTTPECARAWPQAGCRWS